MQNLGRILHRVLKYESSNYVTSRHLAAFSKHPATSQFLLSNDIFSGNEKNISKADFLQNFLMSSAQIRLKSYKSSQKSRSRSSEYESGSDSDSEDDVPVEAQPGSKVVQIQTDSLRCDLILKNGLGISRNKLDKFFYEGRIRVNGLKIMKKSVNVELRDEVDLIKNVDEENPDLLHVGRIEIIKAKPSGDFIHLTIRKFKNLLIENYEKHPWEEKPPEKESEEDEENEESKDNKNK